MNPAPSPSPYTPTWLAPAPPLVEARLPAGQQWYATLYGDAYEVEEAAHRVLRWLLNVMLSTSHVTLTQEGHVLLVVAAHDPVGLALADRAVAQFLTTGRFTQADAEALILLPLRSLLTPPAVPAWVITPAQEARSQWGGRLYPRNHTWFWADVCDPQRRGFLRAATDGDAVNRLREAFPEVEGFEWITRQEYQAQLV